MAMVEEIARWLLAEFEREGYLTQAAAAAGIRARFGDDYAPGRRIRGDVLAAFRRLAPEGRAWSHRGRAWRRRRDDDSSARGYGRRESGGASPPAL